MLEIMQIFQIKYLKKIIEIQEQAKKTLFWNLTQFDQVSERKDIPCRVFLGREFY